MIKNKINSLGNLKLVFGVQLKVFSDSMILLKFKKYSNGWCIGAYRSCELLICMTKIYCNLTEKNELKC